MAEDMTSESKATDSDVDYVSDSRSSEGNSNLDRVVTISFHDVLHSSEMNYRYMKSTARPLLTVEVLGNTHTFTDVGILLFEHYLGDVLDESLDSHLWRFEPLGEPLSYGIGFSVTTPILSKNLKFENQFSFNQHDDGDDNVAGPVRAGDELLFCYDEGSPTHIAVTIENVSVVPPTLSRQDYPRAVSGVHVEDATSRAKRARVDALPVLTIRMDDMYPDLHRRLLQEHRVLLRIGRGSEHNNIWAKIWGGGDMAAYVSSLECLVPFEYLDEAFLAFDRGIAAQIAPGHPYHLNKCVYEDKVTHEVTTVNENVSEDFTIHVRPYPRSFPVSQYEKEYMLDEMHHIGFDTGVMRNKDSQKKLLRKYFRWAFNFALSDEDSTLLSDPNAFSFTKQFPKCAMWLSRGAGTAYWMQMESGVLKAIKGKPSPRKPENVVYCSAKHTTLHSMFADIEDQMALPKSWYPKKCK